MKQLQVQLWKEWREHRRAVYLLTGCMALVAGLLASMTPGGYLPLEWVVPVIVLSAVLSIGPDLFASERQRGTDAFLARTPGALEGAFRAKLIFFLLLFAGSSAYGLGIGVALQAMSTSVLARAPFHYPSSLTLVLVSIGLLWVFCVSTWVKSSALTVPAAFLFLMLAAFPCWLMTGGSGWYRLSTPALCAFLSLAALGALYSARMSFVGGAQRGWSRGRATALSVLAALLFFAPSWAWAGERYMAMKETRLAILSAYVGEGGRYAFVTLGRGREDDPRGSSRRPYTAVIVDLNTAENTLIGQLDGSAWTPGGRALDRKSWSKGAGYPVLFLHDQLPLWRKPTASRSPYDGATGVLLVGEVEERLERARKQFARTEDPQEALDLAALGQDSLRVVGRGSGWVVGIAGDRQLLRIDLRSGLTRVLLDQSIPTLGVTD